MKTQEKTLKKCILFLLIMLGFSSAWAELTFSGYAGVKADLAGNEESDDFEPTLMFQTYFAGQLNFSKSFLIRSEFSFQTADLVDKGPFNTTGATFCIDELSATYIKPFLGNTQYFNLFLGTYEPIGSDVFLQRQFGIKPISSLITESWLGLRGSTAYDFYGAGFSYILHLSAHPVATGGFLYFNKRNDNSERQVNLDWRFAYVRQLISLDFALGLGAPMSQKNGDEDVILLVNTIYLHTGLTFMLGNRYSNSLFLQAGFSNYQIRGDKQVDDIEAKDIYLILEPRIVTKRFQVHASIFSVPEETVEKMIFIEDTLGINLAIFTDTLYVKNKNITFGFHLTGSVMNKNGSNFYFWDIKKHPTSVLFDDSEYHAKLSPFLSLPLLTGTMHAMFQINITDLIDGDANTAFKLSVGYKAEL